VLVPVLAVVALLLMLAGSIYAAPRFADALASAPVIGGPTSSLLRSVGLAPISSRLTPINDTAVSSRYRIILTGAYADASQTILTVQVNPPAALLAPDIVTLSDQFGRQVEMRSGVYDGRTGTHIFSFAALPWPDNSLGARLTLRITGVQPDPASIATVKGNWTLHGQVGVQPAIRLALPADGTIGDTTFHFNSIVRSGPGLDVDLHVTGPFASHLTDTVGKAIPDVSKPHVAFNVRLIDQSGALVQPVEENYQSGPSYEEVHVLWIFNSPGQYRMVVSFEGAGQFERVIDVP
jgi:hypothetical protein